MDLLTRSQGKIGRPIFRVLKKIKLILFPGNDYEAIRYPANTIRDKLYAIRYQQSTPNTCLYVLA